MSDTDLLQRFVHDRDQHAFAELTRRHVDLVYAAARRRVNGDSHLAEDITQRVFLDLARKAPSLVAHRCLVAWLYTSARFTAINALRRNQRRLAREKNAIAMESDHAATAISPDWERIRPVIDEALDELDERDRQFVILRFFDQQSFGSIAQQFAVTENAAQKAVTRALDILNSALAKRGVTSTATALTIALSQSGVAAPASLLPSITVAVAASAPAVGIASATIAALKLVLGLGTVASVAVAAGYWTGVHRQIAVDAVEAEKEDRRRTDETRRLWERLRSESKRVAVAEADTAALLQAIEEARNSRAKTAAIPSAASVVAVPSTTASVPSTRYAVQPGDTLPKIAQAYGVSIKDLRAANPGYDPHRMRVGELITLPPGAALRDPMSPSPAEHR